MSNYIIEILIGLAVTVIGYFLKRTMEQLDKTTARGYQTANDLKVLQNTFELKHENLGQHMEKLSHSMEKLSDKIDMLTDTVVELKHR
jgi:uncharacterized protein YoxC